MLALDASDPDQIRLLPDNDTAIVVLEGLSMYLTKEQLRKFLQALAKKYRVLHILMDIYTELGARVSKFRNPVNDVGVTKLYGIDDIESVINDLRIRLVGEHIFTPTALVDELKSAEKLFFKLLFTGTLCRKIYRLYELESS